MSKHPKKSPAVHDSARVTVRKLRCPDRKESVLPEPLLVVDVQRCFINDFTHHIPDRIARLIECGDFEPVLFTRFVNSEGSGYRTILSWDECCDAPDTDLADEIRRYAEPALIFSKPGYAGISDELATYLHENRFDEVAIAGIDTDMCVLKVALDIFDQGIKPIVLTDCCASTSGLQSHFAGLAVLARNLGANQLRATGLGVGPLGAPANIT
jgi:nicotinamidase-related amidase